MIDTVSALILSAGLIAGLVFNVFAFCLIAAPLFAIILTFSVKAGLGIALATAAKLIVALQVGYIGGLFASQLGPAGFLKSTSTTDTPSPAHREDQGG